MEHLIFLFNLVTLLAGLTVAGALFRAWRRDPRPLPFWRFLHFSGFTFTMAAAALDAYGVVNLGVGAELTRIWTSWVLVGAALMLFSFPHLSRAETARPRPRRFTAFWALLTLIPLAGAGFVLVVVDYELLLLILGVAFLPFWASIFYGLAIGTSPHNRTDWGNWAVFLVLLSLGAVEVWWVLAHPPVDGYYFITLPLAYLFTSWNIWKDRPQSLPVSSPTLGVPEALVRDFALTPRERDMAEGILRGLANKELAFDLGLSENTIRNHISRLYKKLGIQKRLDLVLLVQKYQAS